MAPMLHTSTEARMLPVKAVKRRMSWLAKVREAMAREGKCDGVRKRKREEGMRKRKEGVKKNREGGEEVARERGDGRRLEELRTLVARALRAAQVFA